MNGKLGLVAGGGDLPLRVIEACRQGGREVFVVALKGHTDAATVAEVEHVWIRLGGASAAFEPLRQAGVTELVMAGRVKRPSFTELRPDKWSASVLAKVPFRGFGDDGLLRSVIDGLEGEGFKVISIDDIMTDMSAEARAYGELRPDEAAQQDIERGVRVAKALGREDVGQAVVVQQGVVLGVEAIEGTDALLARCGSLRRPGPPGVLVKVKKPGQEHRADLPTIGVETVRGAAAAGLCGIAVEAGGSLIVDAEAVGEAADAAGLFVVGIEIGE